MIDLTELQQRIAAMQDLLKAKGLDGALFIYPIDVYYFSGTRQNATLWMPSEGTPLLMVRKSLERARQESPLADIRPFPSSRDFASVIPAEAVKLGLTFDVLPVQQLNFYTKLLAGREFVDISPLNREVRSVKSPFEVELLRRSGASLSSVFTQVPEFLRAGMRELDLSAEFECRLRKAGNEGYVRMRAFNQELFQGLAVSAGGASYGFFDGAVTGRGLSNASPHGASLDVIERNVPILLDYTGVFEGYITDMTRIFVVGDLDDELKHAFDVSVAIQAYLQAALKPGAICEELFLRSVEMAAEAGLGGSFMGMPGEQARFVGHGVGLELDEFPVIAQGFKVPLKEGHVIAIEPKFVLPGKGVVGIENTFVTTAIGGVKLTDIPDVITYL
ncbi:Xaa-Pro peptidase family protein [Desulfuromonas sp. AOP6]|uniref:M24 family metallopeptidase n=1 Tax=Desulfuromonas sp. AOP6 TaxID=1566351 RepID=UPI001286132A|nr:Xaa-Pro peptidase family protein [Desulfuromonas sp. AOP6]BCA79961.1 peptidase M24 [Desulfuromonas sp. AOP6]